MPTIDDKVVAMSFENSKFESGVRTTLATIEKLKKSLQFQEAGKGLNNLSQQIGRTNFGPLNKNVDSVRAHFSALNVAASAIIAHIAILAFDAGARIAKSLTLGPIIQGLEIYQTKLQATQTILANTQAAGTKIADVNKALNQLNIYANKTIYSFGQMTKNIGTFTAAGVGLKPAVSAIKGIANLAALSGSNADQASTAMYQLSQAISAGRVSLQDWNSVVNAGMGGSVFQRALAQTAVAMGKINKNSLKLVGPMKNVSIAGQSFRQSIQSGPGKTSWLTSDVLTKTLSTFTGDMTDAQLAAEGFNKQQIKDIQQTAKTALNAATQVKTFSQLMDITKETIATGWSQSFELIIGNLGEAKKLFTDISNSMNNVINQSAASRNKILTDWKKLGGRTLLIKALGEVFKSLGDVLRPIKDAFRDIFPRRTGSQLFELTKRFKAFADTLKPSQKTITDLRHTFRGLFAIVDIGKQIILGVIGVFHNLFHAVGLGHGSFLDITARIGDFLVAIDLALKKGKGLEHFFNGLTAVLTIPLKIFHAIAHAVGTMFDGFSPGHFSVSMDISTKATQPFAKAIEAIINALQGLGPAISKGIQDMNFELILSIIRTGLLAGLVLMIRKFIGGTNLEKVLGIFGNKLGKGFAKNLGGGILGNLSKSFGSLTGSLTAMQHSLQAQTLERIAIAIALLSASIVALSFVKPKRLNAALGAIAIGFGELIGVMVLMDKLSTTGGTIKLPVIAASLVLMATAIDILAIAVFALSKLSLQDLGKGLGAIAILLGTLVGASTLLGKHAIDLTIASVGITQIAIAMNIMALAVLQFGKMDLATLGKGLLGVAGSLVAISIGVQKMPKTLALQAAGLIVIALALRLLADVVAKFGAMDLKTTGKGLLGIGGALVVIAGAMHLMPKNMIITAAGLALVAVSLDKIVSAVAKMGKMSIKQLATGLISLGAALGILALGLNLMSGSLAGAAALTLAAAGLSLLIPTLIALGKQSWVGIIKGLVGLAVAIGIIAVAANVLSESIPALIGFGAALVLIGAGLALAGAGIFLIGLGLSSIAVAGPVAIGILIQSLINLTEALPKLVKNLVLSFLQIVKTFADVAPQFVKALIKIIDALTQAVIKSAPKLAEAFIVLLASVLKALDDHADEIIAAGFDILEKLLKGISDNIGQVVTTAVTIIVNLVDSLARNASRLVRAGANLVIGFVTGIVNNTNKVISAGANIIVHFVKGLANNIDKIITSGAQIIAQLLIGIGNASAEIIKAGVRVATKFIHAFVNGMLTLEDVFVTGLIKFLNGTARIIRKREPELIQAYVHIGEAIVQGMIDGLGHKAKDFVDKVKHIAKKGVDVAKFVLGIHSPSKETYKIGQFFILGLVNGIDDTAPRAHSAINDLNSKMLNLMTAFSLNDLVDHQPTITPVLDLTNVQNGSKKLSSLIDKSPLGSIALNHATAISSARQSTLAVEDVKSPVAGGPAIKFEQHNFSPRELPASEIYRQTKNQLSQFKLLVDT